MVYVEVCFAAVEFRAAAGLPTAPRPPPVPSGTAYDVPVIDLSAVELIGPLGAQPLPTGDYQLHDVQAVQGAVYVTASQGGVGYLAITTDGVRWDAFEVPAMLPGALKVWAGDSEFVYLAAADASKPVNR